MKGARYHLNCMNCGKNWWSEEAFPKCCPYCGLDRSIDVNPGYFSEQDAAEYRKYIHEHSQPTGVNVLAVNGYYGTRLPGDAELFGWSNDMIVAKIRELNDQLQKEYKTYCDRRLIILNDIQRLYRAQGNWRYSF